MRSSERTFGRTSPADLERRACAFSSGAKSMPRHWASTRWRGLILPGPSGGMRRGGRGTMEGTREAEPQTEVDTNCTNFHEFVLIRAVRVFRKLDLTATFFEIQGL